MRADPLAIIDIGSNTIRSLVVQVLPDGGYRVLDDEREVARLASGLNRRGELSSSAIARAVSALRRMGAIARARGARKVAVVATSAIRNAANRSTFVDRVRAETGLRVRVISGAEEARLAFESAAAGFDLGEHPCAVADVGGGSTELILGLGPHIRRVYTFPLGAVSLTEEFLPSDPIRPRELRALRRHIRRTLASARIGSDPVPQFLVASGGTASTVGAIALARRKLAGRPVQGFEMTQAELLHLQDALLRRTLAERREMPGLSPDRADIIVAGVAILYEILAFLSVNRLILSDRGIRHALLNRLIHRGRRGGRIGATRPDRLAAAESFGRSLHFEEGHGEQVHRLSVALFDQLAGPFRLDPAARDLLAAAALLHDVGYVVGYRRHHKHAYHLISHAHLEGFSPREREIIALTARYHRRTAPRRRHRAFAALPKADRSLVRRLAAILRIADALDRRHSQGVQEVRVVVHRKRVVLELIADRDLAVEAHGALEKADLLRKVFGAELAFRAVRSRRERQARGARVVPLRGRPVTARATLVRGAGKRALPR
jgi:exopolyphosphatase/guanosine-5'-triphosphate,3'-diphosphate pyrophosphatase